MTTIAPGARVTVAGHRGVVFVIDGPHQEWRESIGYFCDELGDEYEVDEGELVDGPLVEAHMVGDDRTFIIDPDDCTPYTDPVCSCGQVGCGWHGQEDT